jgi:hypothetical protein
MTKKAIELLAEYAAAECEPDSEALEKRIEELETFVSHVAELLAMEHTESEDLLSLRAMAGGMSLRAAELLEDRLKDMISKKTIALLEENAG